MSAEKRGVGRPKTSLKHLQELAACEAVIWSQSLPLTVAGIELAKNGNATLLKYFYDRIYGRVEDTTPLAPRAEEILKNLPPGFDPEAVMSAIRETLWGGAGEGEWTTQEANNAGRVGVEGLKKLAARGDKDAMSILARSWVPEPMLTLPEQAETMTPEQVRETMIARYTSAWSWLSREEIERMVDAVCQR